MKLFSLIPLSSLICLLQATAAQAGYAASCDQFTLNPNDNTMETYCTPANQGPRRLTRQDLNLCIADDNGNLVAQNNGGFAGSCRNCYAQTTGLYCGCIRDGQLVPTAIDLDSFVQNVNGHLYCFGHYGT